MLFHGMPISASTTICGPITRQGSQDGGSETVLRLVVTILPIKTDRTNVKVLIVMSLTIIFGGRRMPVAIADGADILP